MEATESVTVFDQFGGTFAAELGHGDQFVGVAAVEVNLDYLVQGLLPLRFEGWESVGTACRTVVVCLPTNVRQRVFQTLLLQCKLLELSFIKMDIREWLQRDVIEKIEDVARQDDGEHQKGGRPFPSGKVELCFHSAKILFWSGGCQDGRVVFCEQVNVNG